MAPQNNATQDFSLMQVGAKVFFYSAINCDLFSLFFYLHNSTDIFIAEQWNSAFLLFSLIIEGTTEKVLQFKMPLKSIYNRNFGFIEQNMYFLTLQRVSSKTNSIN
jgi:hypothetical protein